MILDSRAEFCDATALNTGGAGTYLIGSQIDLGASRPAFNGVPPMYFVLQVDTAVDSAADNTTQQFKVASDDSASISTTTSTVHFATEVFAQATLVAGYTRVYPLPPGTYERYLGILQVTGTAAATAGKVNAFITADPKQWVALDNGIS